MAALPKEKGSKSKSKHKHTASSPTTLGDPDFVPYAKKIRTAYEVAFAAVPPATERPVDMELGDKAESTTSQYQDTDPAYRKLQQRWDSLVLHGVMIAKRAFDIPAPPDFLSHHTLQPDLQTHSKPADYTKSLMLPWSPRLLYSASAANHVALGVNLDDLGVEKSQ